MENDPNQPSQDPPVDQSLTPPIPPTPTPADRRTDPKYAQLLEGTVAEQNRRIQELEQRITRPVDTPPQPRNVEEERKRYFEDPLGETQRMVEATIKATIAPLNELASRMQGASVVDRLVDMAKMKFSAQWNASLEAYVRQQASTVPPQNLNEQSFSFLVLSGIGAQSAGLIDGSPSPTPSPAPSVTPPTYIRPSPPPGPPPRRVADEFEPLNENEKKLLREYNVGKSTADQMSEKQYREWQSMPARDVATSKLGRTA